MIVYAIVDDASSPAHPLGEAVDLFVPREDAERFIAEVRNDDPKLAEELRIESGNSRRAGATERSARSLAAREGHGSIA